jgi:hypothetical protein
VVLLQVESNCRQSKSQLLVAKIWLMSATTPEALPRSVRIASSHPAPTLSTQPLRPHTSSNTGQLITQVPEMADESPKPSAPVARTTRPMSEALLNEKVRR